MGRTHGFDAVGDDFAAGQRVLHAGVAHGDAVADRDGVEFIGDAARFADRVADDFADLFEVAMAGNDIGVGVADSDERFLEILVREPGGPHETAVRRAFRPRLHDVAAHDPSPSDAFFLVNCIATL